jgi:hypothetical protein
MIIPALADVAPKTKAAEATAAEIFLFMLNLLKLNLTIQQFLGSLELLSTPACTISKFFVTFMQNLWNFVA